MESYIQSPIIPMNIHPIKGLEIYTCLGNIRLFQKGSSIVMMGEEMYSAAYVLSGNLKVMKVTSDGREKYIYSAGKHSFIGRLFPTTRKDLFVVAQTDSKICFFTKEQLAEIFRRDEELIFEVIKNYHAKVSYFMNQLLENHCFTPRTRIIRIFWELLCAQGYKTNGDYIIDFDLSQKEISEITGTHYVTVSRLIKFLKEEQILEKVNKQIIVYDPIRLEQLATKEID